ncbi:hypothetical protein SAMN05192559_1073 [Halobacillus karajensis]|uniref:hypothetical protein n=1 Tax=Halobacillus karajensis TaxID=195088 RepID=UPI0008A777C6|nr:hypothetical protein [Halobacillus karajensis]SEH99948.1 hypothetical protein SAMN05192559_1073 [Halobacillus karajensis]
MKRKTVAQILIFIIGGLLFTFSIDLPVLGFKKLEFIEETSTHQVINYNWYGKEISEQPFKGDPKEALNLFQKQDRIQKNQVSIVVFSLMTLALWWSREKKRYIYGSAFVLFILVIIDIMLVNKFS